MTSLHSPATATAGLGSLALIEARRMARHPLFLVGAVASFVVTTGFVVFSGEDVVPDVLTLPIQGAFWIGLPTLVAAARVAASTDVSREAMAAAPGTEARRTLALAGVALPPLLAGLGFVGALFLTAQIMGVAEQEWWFATLSDWQVWSILLTCPAACAGGAMLGVLSARWLRFRSASVVVLVALVAVTTFATTFIEESYSEWRLWSPWTMFDIGEGADGRQTLVSGNPAAYVGYLVALGALALLGAMWHDRSARTPRLRMVIAGVVAAAVALLGLAIFTGNTDNRLSDPIPARIQH